MAITDVLQKGIDFTNADPAARDMLADFKDHRVGVKLDNAEVTIVIKDGVVALENGMRDDCHAAMQMKDADLYGAIDNSYDLMEIREKGDIIKGDRTDPATAVHFMALFPYFDAMVRLYEADEEFKQAVDVLKASL
ncbi:MAG: hypothetical protein JW832_08375 [Deltaproteobacteria bacterium]|nr:hypothetical protein [Deltaproteobacteria bacterium]